MAHDDWRLRLELEDEGVHTLLSRLELVRDLEHDRLAVTREGDTLFVYADSQALLERTLPVIDAELAAAGVSARRIAREHWLDDEDRWDDDPREPSTDVETAAHGYAPWEVRIPCNSHHEARELADRLAAEGYGVVRRWSYVIAGTASREQAEELASRLHGEAEPGGELVWEVTPGNPFAIFGGLGA